jgi:hypothetical protein
MCVLLLLLIWKKPDNISIIDIGISIIRTYCGEKTIIIIIINIGTFYYYY